MSVTPSVPILVRRRCDALSGRTELDRWQRQDGCACQHARGNYGVTADYRSAVAQTFMERWRCDSHRRRLHELRYCVAVHLDRSTVVDVTPPFSSTVI